MTNTDLMFVIGIIFGIVGLGTAVFCFALEQIKVWRTGKEKAALSRQQWQWLINWNIQLLARDGLDDDQEFHLQCLLGDLLYQYRKV